MTRTTFLRFGQLRQERGDKHVRNGELVSAINVRQTTKAGVYEKRLGFAMTSMVFSGATWGSARASSCVPAKGLAGSLMRDSQDRAWSRDSGSPTWNYRGEHARCWTDTHTVNSKAYNLPRFFHLEVQDNIWVFSIRTPTGTSCYDLTIYNKSTGAVVTSLESILANVGTSGLRCMSACYDGTDVWMFYVSGESAAVKCHKFAAATPTSTPSDTTFYIAGGYMSMVASCYSSSTNKTIVAFCGNSGGTSRLYHAQLDTATGAAKVSPGVQQVVNGSTALPMLALGFHANQSANPTYLYYHYYGFQSGGSGPTYSGFVTVTVTIATLAWSAYNIRESLSSAVGDCVVGTGYANIAIANGVTGEVIIWSRHRGYCAITCTVSGGSTGGNVPADFTYCGWWIASGIAQSGSYAYFLTGHDDIACSEAPTDTAFLSASWQRAFHVRRVSCSSLIDMQKLDGLVASNANIIGHCLLGSASAQFHCATVHYPTGNTNTAHSIVPFLSMIGTRLVATVAADVGTTGSVGLVRVEAELAKTWGKECSYSGRAYSPGSIPACWSKEDVVHEISPLLAPGYIGVYSSGTGSDFATAAAVYCIRDSDGTLYRSSPYVLSATIGSGAVLYIPSTQHTLPGTTVYIEIYLGTDAKPKLQATVANAPTIRNAAISYTTPSAATMVNGEVLYAVGNALTQAWPPQCQAVGSWRQRLFLAAKNIVWASHEETIQSGPLFNEVMRSTWGDSSSDISAMSPVDWNCFAFLSPSGAAVTDGPGPDRLGSGNYTIKTLSTKVGATAGSPALTGDLGCYFQDNATGRIACITQQLQVTECAGGAYDYSGETVTAISGQEAERQLHFHTSAGNVIVIDYQHKTDTAPFGQVYIWTVANPACAASEDSSGIFYLGSNGCIYRPLAGRYFDHDANGAAVLYRMLIKSAQLQLSDLQGEFDVCKVQVLGKFRTAFSAKITTFPDYATVGNATASTSFAVAPFQMMTRPPSCMRIQSLAIQVEETAGVNGAAFDFEGFAVEWLPRGKMKNLNTSQVVS